MEEGRRGWATGEEMKAFLVLIIVLLGAAATALAYGHHDMTHGMTAVAVQVASGSNEPAALLVSGSLLLGLAGVVRRFTV